MRSDVVETAAPLIGGAGVRDLLAGRVDGEVVRIVADMDGASAHHRRTLPADVPVEQFAKERCRLFRMGDGDVGVFEFCRFHFDFSSLSVCIAGSLDP